MIVRQSSVRRPMWSSTRPGVPTMMCTPSRERRDLLADRRAAVERLDEDAAVLADLRQLARDLQRELARRREDQRLRLAVRRHDLVDDRQTERGRLAGAGARLHHQVLARADRAEHGGLHRRRREVAHVVERLLDVGVQAEVVEARWLRLGGPSSRVRGGCGRVVLNRREHRGVRRTVSRSASFRLSF